MDVNIIDGYRDGSRLYYCGDGHFYYYNQQYLYGHNENTGVVYLRCRHYDSRACRGSASVHVAADGSMTRRNTGRHICAPDMLHGEVRALRQAIIQEAIAPGNRHESPAELVQRVRER